MSDRDEFGAFLFGFLLGGLAGAVTALLIAPASGEETRTLIKERSIELRDRAAQTAEEALARAEAAAAEARARADELRRELEARGEEIAITTKTKAEEVVSAAKTKAEEVVEKAKKPIGKKDEGEAPAEA